MRETIEPLVTERMKELGRREEEEVTTIIDGALAIVQVKGMVWGPGPAMEVGEGTHHLRGAEV
eukprot:2031728-Rhodomonas_salina.1